MPVQQTTENGTTGATTVNATYLQGAQGVVYRRDDVTGTVAWYVYDGLGSVAEEVAPNGTVTAARKYDVYGAVHSGQAGTCSQKFVGKLGHESDVGTGLITMRARYYDPDTGRFLSQDPKGQGENWFSYCAGNPVNRLDASGKSFISDILVPGLILLLGTVFFKMSLPILAGICEVIALIVMVYGICHDLSEAEEDKSKSNNLNNQQWHSSGGIGKWDTAMEEKANALVTQMKESGDVGIIVAGWEAEIEFGVLECDD